MADLSGSVAIVTGAAMPRGIGRAIALRLSAEGAIVVLTDLAGPVWLGGDDWPERDRLDLLGETVSQIRDGGGTAIAQAVDVTSEDEISVCVDTVLARFGRVDILVNNAGSLAGAADFLMTTPTEWTASFRVNLLGPMMFTQAVLPAMRRERSGAIVNIGSTGSLGAEPGFGAYTAMKHGLIGLTKTIAAEFGPDGIRCNAVCPGYIATDMHEAANRRLADENALSIDEMRAQRYRNVALRSAGDPEDVADAVAYLAGPHARYITGAVLPVSGGVPPGI
ncbi:MAG: SDR family NAD(P)-dependent oxidoreductase [Pseudomonadota bacterium]